MRGNELLDKMDLIDAAYVEAAEARPKKKRKAWMKWTAAAACLSLVSVAAVMGLMGRKTDNVTRVSLGGITREYKNEKVVAGESARVWPWEYLTTAEQYATLILNGEKYRSSRAVDKSYTGKLLGSYELTGTDPYTDEEHRMTAEVYQIQGISEARLVAVELEGEFYVFTRDAYAPPADWGEVLDDYALERMLSFEQFTEYDGFEEKGHYRLRDDAAVWEILSACRSAEFVGDNNPPEGRYLSFTATSDALGVYRRVFSVAEDGYVWTNIFDYAYSFRIGREAAEQIFSYAVGNGVESEPEPYTFNLAGTLTEITDGYMIVDDTVLCADEREGMRFKIYLDDMRIRRHIDCGELAVGDLVVISFTGNINVDAGNVVEGVYSLSEGFLSGDNLFIPE